MKKIKFSDKLFLEQTTIAQLDTNQLSSLKGGGGIQEAKTSCFSNTGPGCGTSLADTYTCKPHKF